MKPNFLHTSCWRRCLLVATLLACFGHPACYADGGQLHQLCVWLTGGQKVSYVSTEHPRILPSDGNLHVQTDLVGFDLPRISVLRITMETVYPDAPTAVSLPSSRAKLSSVRHVVVPTATMRPPAAFVRAMASAVSSGTVQNSECIS